MQVQGISSQKLPVCVINKTYKLGSLLAAKRDGVVSFIPLSERCGINDDDCVLHQSLGTNQFVVGGIVNNVDDTGLARNT